MLSVACCIPISFIGRPTIFGVVLQASQDGWLPSGGHNKDTLGPNGTQRLECLPLQCSAPSGAKRAGSHRRSKMLQYLLLWHLGTGQQSKFQSTRKTRGSTLLENSVICLVETTYLGQAVCISSDLKRFAHGVLTD